MEGIEPHDLVSFLHIKNARGYPATGEVVNVAGGMATVTAWGLYGPGTETKLLGVPLSDLKLERKWTPKS